MKPEAKLDPETERYRAECPHCSFAAVRAKREAADHLMAQHLAYQHGDVSPYDAPAARALRAIQKLDELASLDGLRYLLIEAETALGEALGLECTGAPSTWNEAGEVVAWDHDGDTCPVHEWLVEDDQRGLRT